MYLTATPAEFQENPITRTELAGLARSGVTEALTTEQINALLEEKPEWLIAERESYQSVLREERRLKALHAEQARES